MTVSRRDIDRLLAAGVIDNPTADRIRTFVEEGRGEFHASNSAYYIGALVILSALGWLLLRAWTEWGGLVLATFSIAYAVVFVLGGEHLRKAREQPIAAGLLLTLAVSMVPVATFGALHWLGVWPERADADFAEFLSRLRVPRLVVALSTLVGGLLAMRLRPFQLLVAPVALAGWFISVDGAHLLFGIGHDPVVDQQAVFSYGLFLLTVAFLVDRRTERDYAFGLYAFGIFAAWGVMTIIAIESIWYGVFNLIFMALSILFSRVLFMVAGTAGMLLYLAYLAFEEFEESFVFPIAMIVLGVAVIAGGVWYSEHRREVADKVLSIVPRPIQAALPSARSTQR